MVWLILSGSVIVSGLDTMLSRSLGTTALAALLWVGVCLVCRRLHDTGRAAWWLLVLLVPVVGFVWVMWVTLTQRGAPGNNRFGGDPAQRAEDYRVVK